MGVISLRLKDREFRKLKNSPRWKVRTNQLLHVNFYNMAWEFLMVKFYKAGKLSLTGLASKMGMSVGETIMTFSHKQI
ncbi:MAG TPA: hypothetical protein EYP21_01175 [Syntrophaceae bacterium]|nr:hypothetical protein [Syntrophaceae bacterium]